MTSRHIPVRFVAGPLTALCLGSVSAACTATLGFHEEDRGGSGNDSENGSVDPDEVPVSAKISGPAEAPLRRLTKAQYNNTVRDLLGFWGDAAGSFGADEEAGGFASNYLAPVAPLQVEYYELSADELAAYAIENLQSVVRCEGTGSTDDPEPGSQDPVATISQHCNGDGWQISLSPGLYSQADLMALGAQNDDASSLTVEAGYEVILFDGDNQAGGSQAFTADTACLSATSINDLTSSVEVRARNPEPDPIPSEGGDLDTCFNDFLSDFGPKAYRRPLSAEELLSYEELFELGLGDDNDVLGAFELVIRTMLQSPHFLYRVEVGGSADAEGNLPLTPFEIASRLSYFLQNTMPDDELVAAAIAGELTTVQQIEAQARRLLSEPEAHATLATFHEEWLHMGALAKLEKNTEVYPDFTPELRAAMMSEVSDFATHVITQGDGRLETLLTAPYTFAEGPLLQLYDASASPGPVALAEEQRGGLFTLASVMAVHSHPDQTSPVVRGYVVSDKLLCILPPPPPPNLEIEIPSLDPNLPTRERFELHREDPSCAACHQLMDPLGFTFEHYDAIGRYRTMDGINPVDASSELNGTLEQDGPVANAVEMMARLANAGEVRRCVTRQWFRYAFGRLEADADEGTINEAFSDFSANDFRITDLLVALTKTTAFRTMTSDSTN